MHPFAPMPSGAQQSIDAGTEPTESSWRSREQRRITLWRYAQARSLGLEPVDARLFAESPADLAVLRKLRGRGCAAALALRIVL
jgi:hypothetical protein